MSVFVSFLALSILCYSVTLHGFSYLRPISQQRSVALLESFVFWWILLVADTVLMGNAEVGGLYFFTFFYAGSLAAVVLGLLEHVELPVALPKSARHKLVNDFVDEEGTDNTDERTPLLSQNGLSIEREDADEDNQVGLWFMQFLLSVPFPVILVSQLAIVFIHSLSQTGTDSETPGTG